MKVLVVHCHPCDDSLVTAARDRLMAGLHAGGHEVRLNDLYADGFRPELSAWERVHHLDPPDGKPDIGPYADDLRWCEALVLVYPTWWSGQPGMLKGWIDRVWVSGVAYAPPGAGSSRIRPLLGNVRRLVVVTTHGSSKFVNVLEGETGKRVVTRGLRVLCNRWARTKWVAFYGVDRSDAARRGRFLDRVERVGRSLR